MHQYNTHTSPTCQSNLCRFEMNTFLSISTWITSLWCRWCSFVQQFSRSRNRRFNLLLLRQRITDCLSSWCRSRNQFTVLLNLVWSFLSYLLVLSFSSTQLVLVTTPCPSIVPLSVMMVSGRTNLANNVRSSLMTAADDVDGVQMASIHFECTSIRTRIVFP